MREARNNYQGSVNIYWAEKVLKFELQNSVKYYVYYIKYMFRWWGIVFNKLNIDVRNNFIFFIWMIINYSIHTYYIKRIVNIICPSLRFFDF